jgi:hypothetical protein
MLGHLCYGAECSDAQPPVRCFFDAAEPFDPADAHHFLHIENVLPQAAEQIGPARMNPSAFGAKVVDCFIQ